MRGISEDELINIADQLCTNERLIIYDRIVAECRELQEPWMTLEEFLKSGFRGKCWINFRNERVDFCKFLDGIFFNDDTGFSVRRDFIVKVMPIHKPEPSK